MFSPHCEGIKRTAVELTEDEKATLQNKNFEIDFEEHIGQVKVSLSSYLPLWILPSSHLYRLYLRKQYTLVAVAFIARFVTVS